MENINNIQSQIEVGAGRWMKRNGYNFLRISIGVIFLWFGVLKFFPGFSPAQDLAIRTISQLSFNLISANSAIIILATWECLIGLGFVVGRFQKVTLFLLFLQMLGTFTPIFLFPNEIFTVIPYAPTLEGQYIIKNIVIVSAGFVLGARILASAAIRKT
jgi:uncharacterized membrane protein YphA (DoxX/SURF4 family)